MKAMFYGILVLLTGCGSLPEGAYISSDDALTELATYVDGFKTFQVFKDENRNGVMLWHFLDGHDHYIARSWRYNKAWIYLTTICGENVAIRNRIGSYNIDSMMETRKFRLIDLDYIRQDCKDAYRQYEQGDFFHGE